MSEVTLKAIAGLIHEEIEPLKAEISAVHSTVDNHTTMLDVIAKNTANWQTEMAVMRGRMDRYETVIKQMALKLNLDIEPLLH